MSFPWLKHNRNWRRQVPLALVMLVACITPGFAQGAGYWHTKGGEILDANGKAVRIAGITWYGFETTDKVVQGLWAQDYHTILKTIKENGYNSVRLPFSNDMVEHPIVPPTIKYSGPSGAMNTDLAGLNSLQIMDKIIACAGEFGLRIILDNHRSEAGNSAEANGLWYTSAYPESAWIHDWVTLTDRYAGFNDGSGNPIVIGVDLRNEPHLHNSNTTTGSCWTGDTTTAGCPVSYTAHNWPGAAERAGNAILGANSNLLILVEGTDCYSGDCSWWGGNLEGAAKYPVVLKTPDRLVYSPHDYGPSLYIQPWFNHNTTQTSLFAVWNKFFGHLYEQGTAPVWIGEFGTDDSPLDVSSDTPGSQGQWFSSLVEYLDKHPSMNWTYWALNGADPYGLLDTDYDPVPPSLKKQQLLAGIQFPLTGGGMACAKPDAPEGLVAAAASSSQINLKWSPVDPPDSTCAMTYEVFRSTKKGFVPSSSNEVASGLTSSSFTDSGLAASTTYYYAVEAVDKVGSSVADASATTKSEHCHIAYTITNTWPGGFEGAITIENTGSSAMTGWTLTWMFSGNQKITGLWSGAFTQKGQSITVKNESYNGTIPVGRSYSGIGFNADVTGTNAVPASFAVNGTTCQAAGTD
jgi:endoglucanase